VSDAIRLDGVSFRYPGGVQALDGIDIAIADGERVAVVGENGSGKSTLVRHLNGLLRPTAGRVMIRGEDAAGRHVAALARVVGLAFQDPDRQVFAGSVAQEVRFGARNVGLRGPDLDAAVARALSEVGLEAALDTNPYDLGRSRRKLLAIASVLVMGTEIVVLDEPTTGQDAPGIERIERLIGSLGEAGRTVVAISHDMRFVAETFQRVVVMRGGRIILDGTPDEVFAEPNWEALASTYLEPPYAARVSAGLGLGSIPTEGALVRTLAARATAGA
jgi:energy-coupling factor transport system ATP-binding protein